MIGPLAGFCRAYFEFYFWLLHVMIACIAVVVLIRHAMMLRQIKKSINAREVVSDADMRLEIEVAQSYSSYYELFSNSFILVGLFGTMYGFFAAMANPVQETGILIGFDQIRPALATSAFGLVWAILLNATTRFTVERKTDQLRSLYRGKTSEHALEAVLKSIADKYSETVLQMRESILAVDKRLSEVFQTGSVNFADAAKRLADAATELQKSTVDSGTVFSKAATVFQQSFERAASTADRLHKVTNRIIDLPEAISRQYVTFSQQHNEAMTQFSADLSGQFEQFVSRVLTSLASTAELPRLIGKEMRDVHEDYVAVVSEELEQFSRAEVKMENRLEASAGAFAATAALLAQSNNESATKLLIAFETLLGAVREVPSALRGELHNVTADYRTKLEEQHKLHIQKLNELVTMLTVVAEREIEKGRQSLEARGDELRSVYEQAYKQEGERVSGQLKYVFADLRILLEEIQRDVQRAIEGAPDTLSERAASIRDEMATLAAAINQCAAGLTVSVGNMNEGLKSLHDNSRALAPAAAGLRDAALRLADSVNSGMPSEQITVLKEIKVLVEGLRPPDLSIGKGLNRREKRSGRIPRMLRRVFGLNRFGRN
jgi:hypothetical protein